MTDKVDFEVLIKYLQVAADATQDRANKAAVSGDPTKAVICDEQAELLRVLATVLSKATRGY